MKKVYSRYRFFGGFGLLLGLNVLISFGTFMLLTNSKVSLDKVDLINDINALTSYTLLIGLNILFLVLLATQSRFVIADNLGITFINPLLPFLKRSKLWTDFDYYILVDEDSRFNTHEAVWFIKDEKIKGRFSSFYYTNYFDLKKQIKTKGQGRKFFTPIEQLSALIGLKRIKN